MLAFDETYLTKTLAQFQVDDVAGLVGGIWLPDNVSSSFITLDQDFDSTNVVKSASMLECVCWDPSMKTKVVVSMCSTPVQHSFAGTGASTRGNFYSMQAIGQMMVHHNGLILGLAFDAHGGHSYIKKCLHGQLDDLNQEDISGVPFFGALTYEDVPTNPLPRFPIRIAKFERKTIWAICGPCALVSIDFFFYLFVSFKRWAWHFIKLKSNTKDD